MNVNDVDLAIPEVEFPKLVRVLKNKGIAYKLKEWHVLQVFKRDLKIEFDSMEFWLKGLPKDFKMSQIDGYDVKILSLSGLRAFYKRGSEDRLKRGDKNEREKYASLKATYELLQKVVLTDRTDVVPSHQNRSFGATRS